MVTARYSYIPGHSLTTAAWLVDRGRSRAASISFTDLSHRQDDLVVESASPMRDEKTIKTRLEQLRGQLLQWGTPDLMVFTTTKDELRGWIRALEWVLDKTRRGSASAELESRTD